MKRRFLPDRLVVRLAPAVHHSDAPAHRDVRLGYGEPASDLDGGGHVDRTIRRRTSGLRVARAFVARRTIGQPGRQHLSWDPLEEEVGLSRTFRIELRDVSSLEALLSDLAALTEVELVSPQYLCETPFARPGTVLPEATAADEDYAREMIGADEALRREPGDTALIVGLVDSGVTSSHPELRGRLRPGLNTASANELALGIDLVGEPRPRGQDVSDDQGHGTACAGLLVANGYRVGRGLAGAARLLPVRGLCAARLRKGGPTVAVGTLADLDSALKSAVDLGARVINLSFGTPEGELGSDDPVPHAEVVRYALARDTVLVAASGNGGDEERYFPAALPGVIAVGAVDEQREPTEFTSRGGHVALCAPGSQLRCSGRDGYVTLSGTSFAAPLLSGACALVLSRAARRSRALSSGQVRSLLMRTASAFAPKARTEGCGTGILNVSAALQGIDDETLEEAA